MKRGFYTIMAAQFFSSLADNALLIAAISLLIQIAAPDWMTPLLKLFFGLSYVLLAAFVGAFADALPKGRVMFITNLIKLVGCLMMLFGAHPLVAYALVGLGAAAYSPAKYGILTELLPAEALVKANGWIEGLTVGSIILGTVLGGQLVGPKLSSVMLAFDFPVIDTGIDTPPKAAIIVVAGVYLLAAAINLRIPDTGVRYSHQERNPARLIVDFAQCFATLWRDKLGQISLAVTTLFWGAGATLQFIVLRWASAALGLDLSQGATLQAVVAIGIAAGAIIAARVPLKRALAVLPVGMAMGVLVMTLAVFNRNSVPPIVLDGFGFQIPLYMLIASVLLIFIGGLAGFFVVPMNALLQHRGHVLMSAGHSIAVQNFNENLSVLVMLCVYALLVRYDLSVPTIIILFGLFVVCSMALVMRRHRMNVRRTEPMSPVLRG